MRSSRRLYWRARSPPATATAGEHKIKTARFPARKALEEFDFTLQRSIKKQFVEHLGQLDFLHARQNVILLGPSGTGKTHLATALGVRACLAGQRVQFATVTEWVSKLAQAKHQDPARDRTKARLMLIPLIIVDEVGYIPVDLEAANLMFALPLRARLNDRHFHQALAAGARSSAPPRQGPRTSPSTPPADPSDHRAPQHFLRSPTGSPQKRRRSPTLRRPSFQPAKPAYISTSLDIAVIDAFSRMVVGWSIDSRQTGLLLTNALGMALRKRSPGEGSIIHSDQGVQLGLLGL
jgi:hypothetical protein